MKIERKRNAIKNIKEDRARGVLVVPDEFRDERLDLKPSRTYTLTEPVTVTGVSSHEKEPMTIVLGPQAEKLPRFRLKNEARDETLPLTADHLREGTHNMQLGDIKIIEHPLAMLTALNLELDFTLSEASFPTFDYCDRPYLDAIAGKLAPAGDTRFFTVKSPFAGAFEQGYFILEPDEGERRLVVDHQVSYPGKSVGTQRIVTEMTSEFFAYLCDARTPAYRKREDAEGMLTELRENPEKYAPYSLENVLLVDEDRFYNPREKFLHRGVNYEFMMHELIDVTAWLKLVDVRYGGKFVGRLTCFLFDHAKQIAAARFVCTDPRMDEIGVTYD